MLYREEKLDSIIYKQEYLDGIERLIAQRQREAALLREEYVKDIFERPEEYRADLRAMLGWPLVGHTDKGIPTVTFEKLSEEEGHCVYRTRLEILDGVVLTGLFFRARTSGKAEEKRPLVIVQHGGAGTPELISGMYGSTSNYNDMLDRVIKHGTHAFAPQLLLWHESYGVKYDRKSIDARLKCVGSSVSAVEIYAIMRAIDYFESQSYVSCVGMVGLSYGGFYTLFTTALDTRIKAAISCSFFNSRDAVPWSDWVWRDCAFKFDDAEIACLVYPRKLWIEIGTSDKLFDFEKGKESFARLRRLSEGVGDEWAKLIVFEGTHEFCHDDEPIEELMRELYESKKDI